MNLRREALVGFLIRLAIAFLCGFIVFWYKTSAELPGGLVFSPSYHVTRILDFPVSAFYAPLPAIPPLQRALHTRQTWIARAVLYALSAIPPYLILLYLPLLARRFWSRFSTAPPVRQAVPNFPLHFIWAYAVAMLLAGPHLLLAPWYLPVGLAAFPGGLFALVEPEYSFMGGVKWPAIAGYALYVAVFASGLLAKRPWPFVLLALLLLTNIAGCYVQHAAMAHQF
jgi:hypothetical protein